MKVPPALHGRRRFDHLVVELSVALGTQVPRYALWLRMHDYGWNPDRLSRDQAVAFCGIPLSSFLAAHGLRLRSRRQKRLRREIERFDPAIPMPCERVTGY